MLSPCFVSARYDERSTQMEADGGIECHVVMRAYGDLAKDEEGEVISDEAAYNRTEVQGGDWTPLSPSPCFLTVVPMAFPPRNGGQT